MKGAGALKFKLAWREIILSRASCFSNKLIIILHLTSRNIQVDSLIKQRIDCYLVFDIVLLRFVEMNLHHSRAVKFDSCSFADNLSWKDQILEDAVVDCRQRSTEYNNNVMWCMNSL